jgi:molybdopterin molybdotransferase
VALTFHVARETVLNKVTASQLTPEEIALDAAAGPRAGGRRRRRPRRPALSRSVRDGYAVRAADLPGELTVIGEVRAGQRFEGELAAGQAVEIMTGAPIPQGADAVVMVEHTRRVNGRVRIESSAEPRQFINPKGCEAAAHEDRAQTGKRMDYADVAMLAAFGRTHVSVYRKPVVAIVATGDEIVEVSETPAAFQIRNSNAYSLAAQVARAGGIPQNSAGGARHGGTHARNRSAGLTSDLLLLSGGVSAGKYDVVEPVLSELGAEFFFDRVLIQPGQPLVFGKTRARRFFFGLPGNPSATMVTFEILARAAVELLGGQSGDRRCLCRSRDSRAISAIAPGSRASCPRGSAPMARKSRP